jgi:hypothetical protein
LESQSALATRHMTATLVVTKRKTSIPYFTR